MEPSDPTFGYTVPSPTAGFVVVTKPSTTFVDTNSSTTFVDSNPPTTFVASFSVNSTAAVTSPNATTTVTFPNPVRSFAVQTAETGSLFSDSFSRIASSSLSPTTATFSLSSAISNASTSSQLNSTTAPFTFQNSSTTTFPSLSASNTRFTFSNPITNAFTFTNPSTSTFSFSNPATPSSSIWKPTFPFSNAKPCELQFFSKRTSGSKKYPSHCAEVSTQTEEEICVNKLLQGLKEMLLNGKHSDFVLVVKGKEFKVHKIILAAHSAVFAAMMEHDTTEKATGTANIDDFDPTTFSHLLNFLYTGKVENLNSDNVMDLYEVADKYQVLELSNLCIKHMMNNISIDNFCDILYLSIRHHVRDLTEVATQFFLKNSKEIALTSKWTTFLTQNPVAGNELFLKALDMKRE